jgi:hypothetical protein
MTMQTQKYSIQQPLIESLLAWVKEGEIAIPEIQRPPYGGDKSKLRDLMGGNYRGYPLVPGPGTRDLSSVDHTK